MWICELRAWDLFNTNIIYFSPISVLSVRRHFFLSRTIFVIWRFTENKFSSASRPDRDCCMDTFISNIMVLNASIHLRWRYLFPELRKATFSCRIHVFHRYVHLFNFSPKSLERYSHILGSSSSPGRICTAYQRKSLQITASHCILCTANQRKSVQNTANHCKSAQITAKHCRCR